MNNLHISLTEFKNESRLLKQVNSIKSLSGIEHVYIAALHTDELKEEESLSSSISLKRMKLKYKAKKNSMFWQSIKYVELTYKILTEYRSKNIKIINVHSLGSLPIGYIFKKLYKAKLVYDAHELETEKNGLFGVNKKLSKIVEKILIKKVDQTIVVSENIASWYESEYKIPRPVVVFNSPLLAENIINNKVFHKKFELDNDVIVFIYQGMLTSGRGIDRIVEVFRNRSKNNSAVVFMGYGPKEKEIKKLATECDNIFFHEAVSPKVLLEYTASADFGLCLGENVCLSYDYSMPNKLFEYIMAGVPPFVSSLKDMSEFVTANKIGYVMGEDTELLFENADLKVRERLSKRCREVAKSACWENQEKKMLVAYRELLNKR